ncbi:hypothetical protein PR048_025501 [Dryococelus australis]|uniref:Uncharacterized protein n=1 Tax=Dryococelus australis TaxID=614101 RepID=A0ABQ9GRK0_9NEOP|nr:hypothetical protein PR048_025501 [Dryococelus australis]
MKQRRSEVAGETGDPRENPPTSGIVLRDSHMRKSKSDPLANRTGSSSWEAGLGPLYERLACSPPTDADGFYPRLGHKWESCQAMMLVSGFSRGTLRRSLLRRRSCSKQVVTCSNATSFKRCDRNCRKVTVGKRHTTRSLIHSMGRGAILIHSMGRGAILIHSRGRGAILIHSMGRGAILIHSMGRGAILIHSMGRGAIASKQQHQNG